MKSSTAIELLSRTDDCSSLIVDGITYIRFDECSNEETVRLCTAIGKLYMKYFNVATTATDTHAMHLNDDSFNVVELIMDSTMVVFDNIVNNIEHLQLLATNDIYANGLVSMISFYWNHKADAITVYNYHKFYQISLYIIQCFCDTTKLFVSFFSTLQQNHNTTILLSLLCKLIDTDISYSTQEMNIEILCRFALHCHKDSSYNTLLNIITSSLPPAIIDYFNSITGIKSVINDTRMYLTSINNTTDGSNIMSVEVNEVNIDIYSKVKNAKEYIDQYDSIKICNNTYMDLGRDSFSILIEVKNVDLCIQYSNIVNIHFATASREIQISVEEPTAAMNSLYKPYTIDIKHHNKNSNRKSFTVKLKNNQNNDIINMVMNKFKKCLNVAEEVQCRDEIRLKKEFKH